MYKVNVYTDASKQTFVIRINDEQVTEKSPNQVK